MHYDWPVKTAIVNLPIRLKGNSEHISDNSLSPLRAQNKDIGAALQMLLTTFKLNLRRRLPCLRLCFYTDDLPGALPMCNSTLQAMLPMSL